MALTDKLYRPPPRGFDDLFIRVGWGSIELETRAHCNTIVKWLRLRNSIRQAEGLCTLQEARRAYVVQHGIMRLHDGPRALDQRSFA